MPSGLCYECGPKGAKSLTAMKQIKQVRMYVDAHTGGIIYLCAPCARGLGYLEKKPTGPKRMVPQQAVVKFTPAPAPEGGDNV